MMKPLRDSKLLAVQCRECGEWFSTPKLDGTMRKHERIRFSGDFPPRIRRETCPGSGRAPQQRWMSGI